MVKRKGDTVKVFLSQPMNGRTEEEIKKERENVAKSFPNWEIMESYFDDYNPQTGNIGLKYLAKSLEMLADADVACFLEGWEQARGCKIEHDCAVAYGIKIAEFISG